MARKLFVRIETTFDDSDKVLALSQFGAAARPAKDLYRQMIAYSITHTSDGFVPRFMLPKLVMPDTVKVGERDAAALVAVGLLEEHPDGWIVGGFLERYKSRNEIEDNRNNQSTKGSLANHKRWHEGRGIVKDGCQHCPKVGQEQSQNRSQSGIENDPKPIPNDPYIKDEILKMGMDHHPTEVTTYDLTETSDDDFHTFDTRGVF